MKRETIEITEVVSRKDVFTDDGATIRVEREEGGRLVYIFDNATDEYVTLLDPSDIDFVIEALTAIKEERS
jgi:hypothetical protein